MANPGPATGETSLEPIRVGISACLLGEEVRYNGGHKLDRFVRDTLGQYVEFVPVCPEVEIGLGIPRETLRLERVGGASDGVRLVAPQSGMDHTTKMERYARRRAKALGSLQLCGFILKKGSPSCGMERVRVYGSKGVPTRTGRGLFAQALMDGLPGLPVEEEGRLNDPRLRDNFVERIFAYRRLRTLFSGRWKLGQLVEFHSREKLLLLAHDRPVYEQLGRLVAKAKQIERSRLVAEYQALFLTGLTKIATTRKQTNVLEHIAGFLKRVLDGSDRAELRELIERYHQGFVPLVVPLTLIGHHVKRHEIDYLTKQTYLNPHPRELMLRNHV